MFNALVVNKDEESGKTSAAVEQISLDQLPETFESLRSASPHCKVLIDPAMG